MGKATAGFIFDRRPEVPNYFAKMSIGQMENKIYDLEQALSAVKKEMIMRLAMEAPCNTCQYSIKDKYEEICEACRLSDEDDYCNHKSIKGSAS